MSTSAEPVFGPDVIRLRDVTKSFQVRKDNSLKDRIVHFGRLGKAFREDFTAVDDVTLDIPAGTTVGLLGPNGSGKSTLLKLIGGIVSPTRGTVHSRGRTAALLELGAGFHPDLSGRENVYLNASILGLTRGQIDAQFDAILEFSGIGGFIDTAVKFYSSGMYVRLAFAVAVHTDPDVLLVDEVLAVGDEAFQRKCMDRIRQFRSEGCTIILVSHSAQQVQDLCDRGIVLDRGKIVHDGDVNEAVDTLRDVLAQRESAGQRDAATTHPIQVKAIDILDDAGTQVHEVEGGAPFTLRVHVDSLAPVERWELGFSMDTHLGQMAMASNSRVLGMTLAPIVGPTHVDFRIANARFGPGDYFVNSNALGISSPGSHALMRGATLRVRTDNTTSGVVSGDITVAGA